MARKLVMGIIVLLVLASGAGGYVFFVGGEDEAQAAELGEPATPTFMPMDPITLPAIRGDRVRKLVGFRIVLELASGRSASEVRQRLRRVEDAFVTELTSLLAVDWPGDRTIDFEVAKVRLLRESDRVVGSGVVADVLFEQVQVRGL